MIKGFREFILRGNVIDLAVAVVIGAAFTQIVNVIVSALINPLISLFFKADSLNEALQWVVPTLGGGKATFAFGAIIGAIINFLAVAVVVYFVFVYPMNKAKERADAKAGVGTGPEEQGLPTEQELLVQIRDLLEKERA
ncbi:MAG: large conductance mechanosensitive channel protein MscL [Microbacterium sp.]|nr:large conductance mechanosensitive channel protein MscL [Microbacterium sp.]